jgi:hypothetical protein
MTVNEYREFGGSSNGEVPSSPRSSRAGGEPVILFDPETSVSGDSIVV